MGLPKANIASKLNLICRTYVFWNRPMNGVTLNAIKFDSSIGSNSQVHNMTVVEHFSKCCSKHTLNSIHKSCKLQIIDSNVMDWANVTKRHTPPSTKRYFRPDEHVLYKDNFATGNGWNVISNKYKWKVVNIFVITYRDWVFSKFLDPCQMPDQRLNSTVHLHHLYCRNPQCQQKWSNSLHHKLQEALLNGNFYSCSMQTLHSWGIQS